MTEPMMQRAKGILPIKVRRIRSRHPCESCGYRYSRYQAILDPPGDAHRVKHRLCDNCIEAIRQ